MPRFDIGGYTKYNAQRISPMYDEKGRFVRGPLAPIRPKTYTAMQQAGVHLEDIAQWFATNNGIIQAAKLAKAAEVRDYWKSISPLWGDKPPRKASPKPFEKGEYRDSIKISASDGMVRVGTDLKGLSHWLEYGSIHNPEHGYGARVLEHFGGGDSETRDLFVA